MPPVAKKQVHAPAPQQARPSSNGAQAVGLPPPLEAPVGEGLKVCAYGVQGSGKTRLFSTFPKPSLLLGWEDGTRSIADSRKQLRAKVGPLDLMALTVRGKPTGIDYLPCSAMEHVDLAVQLLAERRYRSCGWDHCGATVDVIVKEMLGLDRAPTQKGFKTFAQFGKEAQSKWGELAGRFKDELRKILDLCDSIGLDFMAISHERVFKDEGDSGDIIRPTVGSALTPSCAGWLHGVCDYVCQTYIRRQMRYEEVEVVPGEPKQRIGQATGKMEYCLRVGGHDTYLIKFRCLPGVETPEAIVWPDYAKICQVITGDYQE